jgi:predicted HicB family RNase H-like nuclease
MMKEFLEAVNYRITETSDLLWECFGPNAMLMDSWNGDQNGVSATVTFDSKDQTVFQLELHDYQNKRAYRWINPSYKDAQDEEAKRIIGELHNIAWDDVEFIDLELATDILTKIRKAMNGEEYDTRIQIKLTLEDDEMFELMKMAHERDITLNELVEDILRKYIDKEKHNG